MVRLFHMKISPKKLYAEAFGTAVLTSVVVIMLSNGAASGANQLFVIIATIAMLVYMFGPISGAHFNPAVTVGMAVIKKISWSEAGQYITAQLLGATGAWLLLQMTPASNFSVLVAQALGPNTRMDFISEFFGTAILVLAVSSVALGRVTSALSGAMVGLGLATGIGVASALFLSGTAVLNPAVGLALDAGSATFICAQLAGGMFGATVGNYFFRHSD